MARTKYEFKLLAIVASVFFTGYFLESLAINETILENFEILAELFTVFASFSIFAITWYAYSKARDNHALFLGAIFLVTGLFDLFHVLSYPFMPDFITANSHQKSIIFWSGARVISAFFFFASVYVYKDTVPQLINKYVLFISAIAISFSSFIAVLFYQGYLPLLEYQDGSATGIRDFQVVITAIITLFAGYLYSKRVKETGEINLTFLIYGFIIAALSDFVYFDHELAGHLLKITAFYYIFIALYESSVELPYEKLAIAEEKLRHAAEEKYHTLYESSSDAIMLLDKKGFFDCNKSTLLMFGFSKKEDFIKMHPADVSPPHQPDGTDSLAAANNKIAEAVRKGTNQFEWVHRRKSGEDFPAEVLLTAFHLGEELVLQATVRDITERRRAESGLRLRGRIIETMAEGVYLIRASDGVIVYANPKFEQMFGYGQGELIGKPVSIVNAPAEKNPQEVAAEIIKALNETGEWSGEVYNIRKDGTTFWCHANVSTFQHPEHGKVWISVHTDITERKLSGEKLRESEERYRRLVDFSPYGIGIHSEGKFVFMNQAGARILGAASPDEFIGKNVLEIIHPDYHNLVKERIDMQAEGKVAPLMEEKFLRLDGAPVDVEIVAIPFTYMGKPAMYGVFRDVTERKKAELEYKTILRPQWMVFMLLMHGDASWMSMIPIAP